MKIKGTKKPSDKRIFKYVGSYYGRESATLTNEELRSVRVNLKRAYESGGAYKSDVKKLLRAIETDIANRV